jgi:hypothetical protein
MGSLFNIKEFLGSAATVHGRVISMDILGTEATSAKGQDMKCSREILTQASYEKAQNCY